MNHDPSSLIVAGTPATPMLAPLPARAAETLSELFDGWRRLAQSESGMPPISPLIFRLLQVDRDAPLAVSEVAEIVESDPILTARLLGLANAAAYGGAGKPIKDVKSAVIRLGVYNAFETTFTQMFGLWVRHASRVPDDALLDTLWLEYLITAFCSRELASALTDHDADPGLCYTAALLHDVGTLALCWAEPKAMATFVQSGYARGTPLHQQFVEAHTNLGAALLNGWNAPREMGAVAARHHIGLNGHEDVMTSIVYIADHLHDAVLLHEASDFRPPEGYVLGCFGGATEDVTAALTALGLVDKVGGIIDRVAGQSARIEALAVMP
ncbi:MAG: HDOD domain-containing protein [Burkholderiales bacterium]